MINILINEVLNDKRLNDPNKLICIDYLNRLSQINEALDDVFTTGRKNGK